MGMDNGQMPMPMLPASIRSRALVAGQLLDFDEAVETVVARLEAARIGGNPAELHADHRQVFVSPKAAEAWVTAWGVNPKLTVVNNEEAVSALTPRRR